MDVTFSGAVEGNDMKGSASAAGTSFDFTATRPASRGRRMIQSAKSLLLTVLLVAGAAAGQNWPPATLIKNATILTITKGTIEHGSILIRDGKIAAVGKEVTAPADATPIDATGQYVIAGIIDCHSHIAVDGSVNEGSVSVSSMVEATTINWPNGRSDACNPWWPFYGCKSNLSTPGYQQTPSNPKLPPSDQAR